jgi:hypothetical protein
MSQHRFEVGAWTPNGDHVEGDLGEFANLLVATNSWPVFLKHYAKRRLISATAQGRRVGDSHFVS